MEDYVDPSVELTEKVQYLYRRASGQYNLYQILELYISLPMMDDIDAPTWTDFVAPSPQIPLDDYFFKHEQKKKHNTTVSDSLIKSIKKLDLNSREENSSINGSIIHNLSVNEENDKVVDSNETSKETSDIKLEISASSVEHETSNERSEPDKNFEIKNEKLNQSIQNIKNKLASVLQAKPSMKKVGTLAGYASRKQMGRRKSIINDRQTNSFKVKTTNKYVSMAEAVTKFQQGTPERFHTITTKSTRAQQLKQMSFKCTRAVSPALKSKTRVRPVTALSREEQEILELEKIRQNKIKANPVRRDILARPAPLKRVEKKLLTCSEPFQLTEVKKGNSIIKQDKDIKRAPHRIKTVPTIDNSNEKEIIIKEEEVLHYGIPVEPCEAKKKITKVQPFSFEARNKALQMKKQEKIKQLKETEKQKVKAEFHARPVPANIKTPGNKPPTTNSSVNKPKITIARSLSFEERNKQLQKKKEEKLKQMLEEEKKARSFKAQKVPEFKPVLVRGRSRDNLIKGSKENLAIKPDITNDCKKRIGNILKKSQENLNQQNNLIKKPTSIPFVAPRRPKTPKVNNENQENKNLGAVPKILKPKCKLSQKSVAVLSELNTDKRAKQRKEFEDRLKKKELDDEEIKKKEEEERQLREKVQIQELRKMQEVKARPMPVFKPISVIKSNKPLTVAESPAWSK